MNPQEDHVSRPTWAKVVAIIMGVILGLGVLTEVAYSVIQQNTMAKAARKQQSKTAQANRVSDRKPIGYDAFVQRMSRAGYSFVPISDLPNPELFEHATQAQSRDLALTYLQMSNIPNAETVFSNVKQQYTSNVSAAGKGKQRDKKETGYESWSLATDSAYYCFARVNNEVLLGQTTPSHQKELAKMMQSMGF